MVGRQILSRRALLKRAALGGAAALAAPYVVSASALGAAGKRLLAIQCG